MAFLYFGHSPSPDPHTPQFLAILNDVSGMCCFLPFWVLTKAPSYVKEITSPILPQFKSSLRPQPHYASSRKSSLMHQFWIRCRCFLQSPLLISSHRVLQMCINSLLPGGAGVLKFPGLHLVHGSNWYSAAQERPCVNIG